MKDHGWSLKCIIKIDWKENKKKKRNTQKNINIIQLTKKNLTIEND